MSRGNSGRDTATASSSKIKTEIKGSNRSGAAHGAGEQIKASIPGNSRKFQESRACCDCSAELLSLRFPKPFQGDFQHFGKATVCELEEFCRQELLLCCAIFPRTQGLGGCSGNTNSGVGGRRLLEVTGPSPRCKPQKSEQDIPLSWPN